MSLEPELNSGTGMNRVSAIEHVVLERNEFLELGLVDGTWYVVVETGNVTDGIVPKTAMWYRLDQEDNARTRFKTRTLDILLSTTVVHSKDSTSFSASLGNIHGLVGRVGLRAGFSTYDDCMESVLLGSSDPYLPAVLCKRVILMRRDVNWRVHSVSTEEGAADVVHLACDTTQAKVAVNVTYTEDGTPRFQLTTDTILFGEDDVLIHKSLAGIMFGNMHDIMSEWVNSRT